MGAGASVDESTKTAVLAAHVDALAAMAAWKVEYCVCGQVQLRDGTEDATAGLVCADAAVQVVEEAGSPRMTVMGVPTEPTGGNAAVADELRARTYWIAHFDNSDAYHVEHKKRPSNAEFAGKFAGNWKFFPELSEGTPPTKEQMMQAGAQSMAGSYMGPMWHLEKPGATAGGESATYVVRAVAKCKNAAAAEAFVAYCKATGLRQLAEEEGALRYTVVPPPSVGIPGVGPGVFPGPADDVTVTLIVAYKDRAAYDAHRASDAFKANLERGASFVADPATDAHVLEFAQTKHFSKPEAGARGAPLPSSATLVSEDGKSRITLQDGVAAIGLRQAEDGEFEDWRSCACTLRDGGELQLVYTSKKKGGTVEYSVVADFEKGTFTGDVSYEE